MPIEWLVEYWQKMAKVALPFLQGRRIAIEQKFNHQIIYRRHRKIIRGKKNIGWIYIDKEKDIIDWARQHTYSFHAHLEGEDETYFAMDIDNRSKKMPFELMKDLTAQMGKILVESKVGFMLKFSGGSGFHFIWAFKNKDIKGLHIFDLEQKIISYFQRILEKRLQEGKNRSKFYKYLNKNDPITITNSQDREHKKSVLIDEFILKRRGVIRSPYSIHPRTLLASVPLNLANLSQFNPEKEARAEKVMKRKKTLKIPFNSPKVLERILKDNEGQKQISA